MSPRVTPTLLLRRRSVRIWIALSVVVGVAAVRLFLEVYSSVDEKMQWEIEIIAGLLILGTLGNLGAYWMFGQTVSGGDWRHNDAADAALAYIVITENAVTAGPTTTTSRPHQQPDRLYKKLWSVITRR
jgi:hypothetical protein